MRTRTRWKASRKAEVAMARLKSEALEELWDGGDKAWQQIIDKLNKEVLPSVAVDMQTGIG